MKLPALTRRSVTGGLISLGTIIAALAWAFPLYWGIISSLKPEDEVVRPFIELWPEHPTIDHYIHTFQRTLIGYWYMNSVVTALGVTVLTISSSMLCGYAISQLQFRGRETLYWFILACFMVPTQTLIINHFELMAAMHLINTWPGLILPQLIQPVVIIVYKRFFDGVPKEFREAAILDNASEWRIFSKVYLPMNWGVTTALAIVVFIGTWNNFLWPFLAATQTETMTVPVGITQVSEAFGIYYARRLAAAVLAGLPVALLYLIFQRRVTEAITLSAGIKG